MGFWDNIKNNVEGAISPIYGASSGKDKKNVQDFFQNNYDTFAGLYTFDYGRSRNAATNAGIQAGRVTNLIEAPKKPQVQTPPTPPDESAIANAALKNQNESLRRMRASRTLFAGSGLDSAPSASATLLGGY
jgi:hypothetical protein